MSPLGSIACVSCLKVLIYKIRLIRSIRVRLKTNIVFFYEHKNQCSLWNPCGTKQKTYTVCLSLHSVGVHPSFSLKRR